MRRLVFQAFGKNFHATRFARENVEAFDAGQVATFGRYQGTVAQHGAARFHQTLYCSGTESVMIRFCREMAALQVSMRAHGADSFILYAYRDFTHECNEELTRQEPQEIAQLDCHLFYSARKVDHGGSTQQRTGL